MLTDVFGVRVQFVMGMTDIDDKIIARANECGVEPGVLAARFEGRFVEDMRMLGVRPPEATLRVSEHVDEIIAYIDGIMARGMAYESHQGVQFDTRAFGDSYGACFGNQSHVDAGAPEGASGSSSVDDDTGGSSAKGGKRDARDFALWKAAKPGEPSWPSPWGDGRPGWHIECSAMAHAVLGGQLDLHSGGVDLAFPHHTNEIAQCEAFHGAAGSIVAGEGGAASYQSPWVKAFVHTGHVYISGRKMSKSLKNFITIRELLQVCCGCARPWRGRQPRLTRVALGDSVCHTR